MQHPRWHQEQFALSTLFFLLTILISIRKWCTYCLLDSKVTCTLRVKLPSRSIHEAVAVPWNLRRLQRSLQRSTEKDLQSMLLGLWALSSHFEFIILGSKAANLPGKIIISILHSRLQKLGSKVTDVFGKAGVPTWVCVPLEWGLASGRPEAAWAHPSPHRLRGRAALSPSTRESCSTAFFYLDFLGKIDLTQDFQKILSATFLISFISCLSIWKERHW